MKSFIKTTVLWGALLCVVLLCVSCENFLSGSKVKDDLEKAILIANSECPVATVEEPAFSDTGVARNKTIVISFTMPMDPATINGNYAIKDSEGNSLLDNFLPPVWSNDNKVVSIYANKENLINVAANSTLDVYFTLTKGCTTPQGLPIKTEINHKYRVNGQTKSEPPVLADTSTSSRPQIKYRNTLLSDSYLFTEGQIPAADANAFYVHNHTNSNLDFYVEGRDYGGGKIYAYITYKRLYNADGTVVSNAVEKEINLDRDSKLLNQQEASGNKFRNISYDMAGQPDYKDGLYEFNIRVEDEYDNISEDSKTYYVICDTQLSKSSNAMFWFETPMYRQDWEEDKEWWYPSPYDQQVATEANMEYCRRQIRFNYLVDDVYYISPDSTQYIDKVKDFKYLISWGFSLDKLCEPVEMDEEYYEKSIDYYLRFDSDNWKKYKDNPSGIIPAEKPELANSEEVAGYELDNEGNEISDKPYFFTTYDSWLNVFYYQNFGGGDPGSIYFANPLIKYNLPDQFYRDSLANKDKDIYVQTTIIDSVGNVNTIESVIPKAPQVYSYKVEEVPESNKKKITINYSDSTGGVTRFTNVPNKQVDAFYRVFYAQTDKLNADTSNLALIRNTLKPFKEDNTSDFTDKNEFEITYDESNKYVVVYIQPNYQTHSLVNEVYTGQTFGPFTKVVIDTSENTSTENDSEGFSITNVERESAGPNTGLLNITLTLEEYDADTTYVPYYSKDPKSNFGPAEFIAVNDCTVTSDGKIQFTIANPLRPPVYPGEQDTLIEKSWDDMVSILTKGDYDFTYDVKFKVLATKNGISKESSNTDGKDTLTLEALKDDNIPPRQSSRILSHDSRLDYDGKSFIFDELIIEGEGHIKPYFTYYYTNYNGIWGDNLNVLSPEEIEKLPGGIGSVNFGGAGVWDWDGGDGAFHFSYSPVVPVAGLEDGSYMFFAKVEDTQGNYAYITLGKAHVGTFKNKPQVTTNTKARSITAEFTRNAGEELEKTYINIQQFWKDYNNYEGKWNSLYGGQNELQKLDLQNSKSDSIIYSPSFEYFEACNDNEKPDQITSPEKPYQWSFYRVTVQGFNTHPYDAVSNSGVCIDYGRPYVDIVKGQPVKNVGRYYDGYNQTEYDLCTEETVSYTTYVYLPGEGEDLSDIRSSFSTSDATVISNKKYIVNVLCSPVDLGSNADEWERRGKLIRTHYYEPDSHYYYWYDDENNYEINPYYHQEFDPTVHPFNISVALQDLFDSTEKGQLYYAAVVHFADNSYAVSDVKSAVLF